MLGRIIASWSAPSTIRRMTREPAARAFANVVDRHGAILLAMIRKDRNDDARNGGDSVRIRRVEGCQSPGSHGRVVRLLRRHPRANDGKSGRDTGAHDRAHQGEGRLRERSS